ncbi:hypothetical protein AWJ20_129 [Sugiyamaella lignohabitans]|uniref:RING-type domain-containing protein n=1 Tax=Sugiyamaella lignohabitans TaxID=796027 RepID=A0A167CMX6_9ASCO|nr:uncharacterized protein AWJ20_129 [Sugiyamaella lignohabitans]ANB11902.1 hypothetical protein AWJ20_129 [Sugiyamaella lignohabitans]
MKVKSLHYIPMLPKADDKMIRKPAPLLTNNVLIRAMYNAVGKQPTADEIPDLRNSWAKIPANKQTVNLLGESLFWDTYLIMMASYGVEVVEALFQQRDAVVELCATPYYFGLVFDNSIIPSSPRWIVGAADNLLILALYLVSQISIHTQAIFKSQKYRLLLSCIIFGPFMLFEGWNFIQYESKRLELGLGLLFFTVGYPIISLIFVAFCFIIYSSAFLLVGGPSKMRTPFGSSEVGSATTLHDAIFKLCKAAVSDNGGHSFIKETMVIKAPSVTWVENPKNLNLLDSSMAILESTQASGISSSTSSSSSNSIYAQQHLGSKYISWLMRQPNYSTLSYIGSMLIFIIKLVKKIQLFLIYISQFLRRSARNSDKTSTRPDLQSGHVPFILEELEENESDEEEYNDHLDKNDAVDPETSDIDGWETESESESNDSAGPIDNGTFQEDFQELLLSGPDSLQTLLSAESPRRDILQKHLFNNSGRPLTRSQYTRLLENDRQESLKLIQNRWHDHNTSSLQNASDFDNDNEDGPDLPSSNLCVICISAPRQVVLFPCGCLLMCEPCRETLASQLFSGCVNCRRKVESYSHVVAE